MECQAEPQGVRSPTASRPVANFPRQLGSQTVRGRMNWSSCGAFGLSTAIHVCVLMLFAWLLIDGSKGEMLSLMQVRWVEEDRSIPEVVPPLHVKPELSLDTDPGGRPNTIPLASRRRVSTRPVPGPLLNRVPVNVAMEDATLVAGFADKVGSVNGSGSGKGKGKGFGLGTGGGGGASKRSGFFGAESTARTIVYVLDCSGSMNTAHNSEWKTRFRRLKAEMVKSIGSMNSNQQFYIMFFNDQTIRMPARWLQPATPDAKQRYLKWMIDQPARGFTDPRGSLQYALLLKPDVMYFLTDGAFSPRVQQDLMKIQQSVTVIHTFAFGNRVSEIVLKKVAASNRGKYHYIP